MGKTLLRPAVQKKTNLLEVERADENTDLEQLTDEMKPFLEKASQQLLKPDAEVVAKLVRKLSGELKHGNLR